MSDKVRSQFIDTNVLVYSHDSSAGVKHETAKELVRSLWESEEGCLSIQVLQEFYVTVTHKVAKPLSAEQAAEIITNMGRWRTHSPTVADVEEAISLQSRYQVSFWDSMILCSALRLGCEVLWSEDLNAGQKYETVLVLNPFTDH